MTDFAGRQAIVTGGTRGIGRGVTEALLAKGAKVVAIYAGNDEAAKKFADEVSRKVSKSNYRDEMGTSAGELITKKIDVADYSACEGFYKWYEAECGDLWLLVNNAGIRRDAVVGMMKDEDWRRVIDVNLTGTFNMSKFAVMAMMRKRFGRIVSITSPMGAHGFSGQANYAASKAGQVAFTKSLAKEVASRKITVNCISPGFIDTELLADLPEAQVKEYKAMTPMRRFGTIAEVANAILFLASDDASFITGATLEVTGGL